MNAKEPIAAATPCRLDGRLRALWNAMVYLAMCPFSGQLACLADLLVEWGRVFGIVVEN